MATQDVSPALQRLIAENAVEQLRQQKGRMAMLGSENGVLKLDWVEGIERLLADSSMLEQVEEEARTLWERGIRHILWAGMGGSIMAVHVMRDLGFCGGHDEDQGKRVTIYPLDSTDPASLNSIVRKIAQAKKLTLSGLPEEVDAGFLQALLDDVMMIGVSMGMTSEEPITHLEWFTALLQQAGLSPSEHLLVMTLPGSYLDLFAQQQQAPSLPLQLDHGTGTGGRMSAPTTRVFLLPAALYLTRLSPESGQLRAVLQRAWHEYNLDAAMTQPAEHPFVRLAVALSDASIDGACRLLLNLPEEWQSLMLWIEQLMEESLGKGNKGVVVFPEQPLRRQTARSEGGTLHVQIASGGGVVGVVGIGKVEEGDATFVLAQPLFASAEPRARLAGLAASFLGWQLSMALYGYVQDITFSGQPAVENYKARARALRTQGHPLQVTDSWAATSSGQDAVSGMSYRLLAPAGLAVTGSPAVVFASVLRASVTETPAYGSLGYLDFTLNGELLSLAEAALQADADVGVLGNKLLGIAVKRRRAPAAYHSTEQSEMDGPPFLVSLRVLARDHEQSLLGSYDDTFLRAQAVSTWQAMLEQNRPCFLLIFDGTIDDALAPLHRFLAEVVVALNG